VFASVNLPLHHKVQKVSSGTDSPGWSRRKAVKQLCCGGGGGGGNFVSLWTVTDILQVVCLAVCTAELYLWFGVPANLLHSAGSVRYSAVHHVTTSAVINSYLHNSFLLKITFIVRFFKCTC